MSKKISRLQLSSVVSMFGVAGSLFFALIESGETRGLVAAIAANAFAIIWIGSEILISIDPLSRGSQQPPLPK